MTKIWETKRAKKMRILTVKYLKIAMLLLASGLLPGCSGLKVMIETEQPDDDFVVECIWSSSGFKMHGGRAIVHSDSFVASSGDITDCGVLWYGAGPRIQVSHPLYISDKKYEKNIYNSDGEIIDTIVIYKMQLKEDYLDELIRELKGRDLTRIVRERLGGGFSHGYLTSMYAEKKIKPGYFKEKYEKRLTQYWEKLLPIIQDDFSNEVLRNYKVEDFVNRYWKTVNKFYRLT